ncbi:MAG: hypothetical protein R2715_07320 [Ilumatobacteraceae bacterium]
MATNMAGTAVAQSSSPSTSASVAVTLPLPAETSPPSIVVPALSIGSALTVTDGTWAWSPTLERGWYRCTDPDDVQTCTDIPGANGTSYRLTPADVGRHLRTLGFGTNATGTTEGQPSGLRRARSPPRRSPSSHRPRSACRWSSTGSRFVGETIVASEGSFELPVGSNDSSLDPSAWEVQWIRCTADGSVCLDIAGATEHVYTITLDDLGSRLEFRVRPMTESGNNVYANSLRTGVVLDPTRVSSPTRRSGSGAIRSSEPFCRRTSERGSPRSVLRPPSPFVGRRARPRRVPDASTSPTHLVTSGEASKRLQIVVTATNRWGSASRTSARTGPVRFAGGPAVEIDAPDDGLDVVNGSAVSLVARATSATSVSYRWRQVSGAAALEGVALDAATLRFTAPASGSGVLEFQVVVTQPDGQQATADVVVRHAATLPTSAPVGMCEVLGAVSARGSVSMGSIATASFGTGSVSSTRCTGDVTASFAQSRVSLGGLITLSDASGTIGIGGVTLTSGTIALADGAFDGLRFRILDPGLVITFGAAPTMSGAVVADGLVGLPAPSGFTATTRLSFSGDAGARRLALLAVAHDAGTSVPIVGGVPAPPASAGVLRIAGTVNTGGSIDLVATATGLVDLGDGSITLTGTVVRAAGAQGFTTAVSGRVEHPISVGDVTLQDAEVTYAAGTITGSVTVLVGDSFRLDGQVAVTSREQWSISVTSSADRLRVAPGLEFVAPSVRGSIRRSATTTTAELSVSTARWTPFSGLDFRDATVTVGATCTTGSTCTDQLALTAAVRLDVVGAQVGGIVDGTISFADGSFSRCTPRLDRVSLVPGLDLDSLIADVTSDGAGGTDVAITLRARCSEPRRPEARRAGRRPVRDRAHHGSHLAR